MKLAPDGRLIRTPEDRERHRAIRERFDRDKPTLEELVASGEYTRPIPLGLYFTLRQWLHQLKKAREAAGLTLADVARRSGLSKKALEQLENGKSSTQP